jgi:hypothetical protein
LEHAHFRTLKFFINILIDIIEIGKQNFKQLKFSSLQPLVAFAKVESEIYNLPMTKDINKNCTVASPPLFTRNNYCKD